MKRPHKGQCYLNAPAYAVCNGLVMAQLPLHELFNLVSGHAWGNLDACRKHIEDGLLCAGNLELAKLPVGNDAESKHPKEH